MATAEVSIPLGCIMTQMITYEFECDTCDLMHTETFDSVADAEEFANMWAAEGFNIRQVA